MIDGFTQIANYFNEDAVAEWIAICRLKKEIIIGADNIEIGIKKKIKCSF